MNREQPRFYERFFGVVNKPFALLFPTKLSVPVGVLGEAMVLDYVDTYKKGKTAEQTSTENKEPRNETAQASAVEGQSHVRVYENKDIHDIVKKGKN